MESIRSSCTIKKRSTTIKRKQESLFLKWAYTGNQEKNLEISYGMFPTGKKVKRKTQILKARYSTNKKVKNMINAMSEITDC